MSAVVVAAFAGFLRQHRRHIDCTVLAVVGGSRTLAATPARAARCGFGGPVCGGLFLGFGGRFRLDQRTPVGDRDLIIVGMDLVERQEAMAVAAVIDEGGLQRRLHPRDFGEVDITPQQFARGGLEVEFLDAAVALHHHPGFFRVSGIDQHLVVGRDVPWWIGILV